MIGDRRREIRSLLPEVRISMGDVIRQFIRRWLLSLKRHFEVGEEDTTREDGEFGYREPGVGIGSKEDEIG